MRQWSKIGIMRGIIPAVVSDLAAPAVSKYPVLPGIVM